MCYDCLFEIQIYVFFRLLKLLYSWKNNLLRIFLDEFFSPPKNVRLPAPERRTAFVNYRRFRRSQECGPDFSGYRPETHIIRRILFYFVYAFGRQYSMDQGRRHRTTFRWFNLTLSCTASRFWSLLKKKWNFSELGFRLTMTYIWGTRAFLNTAFSSLTRSGL